MNPSRVDSALDALDESGLNIIGYEKGFSRRDSASRRLGHRAIELASKADVVLLFLGLDESAEAEAIDRAHMRLAQNQLALTERLIATGKPIVVVLAGGAPVELPFADNVDAIVHSYLAGQGGGRAVVDVLTGKVNPSGKLAETYPVRYEDVPSSSSFARTEATSEHRESIYVGYRYFDKIGAPVRYPFGHGMSYTEFRYSEFVADASTARLTVTNTGERTGAEVVQIYVEAPDAAAGVFRAPRELRGFAKVNLAPGESATVEIKLAAHAFDIFDAQTHDWRTVSGTYTVLAGASSRDIRLRVPIEIAGDPWPGRDREELPHYFSGHVESVAAAEFEVLLGGPLPSSHWPEGAQLTRDDILAQMKGRGGFGGMFHALIVATSKLLMTLGRPLAANNVHFALDLPFRSIPRLSGGKFNDDMLDGLLLMVNRRFFRGAGHLIGAAWRARSHTSPNSQTN